MTADDKRIYTVEGMSCTHCVAAVKEELERIPGVARADVSLDDGAVTVTGESVGHHAVRIAVETAGYELAGR